MNVVAWKFELRGLGADYCEKEDSPIIEQRATSKIWMNSIERRTRSSNTKLELFAFICLMVNDDGCVNEIPSGFLIQHRQMKDKGKANERNKKRCC